jgi:XTP/dITP diphosphohydrolase
VTPAEETGATFLENALLKARAASEQTGLPALADDSGLAVDALGGAPGVHSARLRRGQRRGWTPTTGSSSPRLQGVADAARRALYLRPGAAATRRDPVPLVAQGRWQGRILEAPQGEGGFGYDPLFWSPTRPAAQRS